ncbi:MAG: hypothetical protein ABFD97_13380 [Syntrophobacter sp.]
MEVRTIGVRTRLYLIAAIILAVGLGSSIIIYLTADPVRDLSPMYDFQNSKRYIHDLEVYGGKLNVLSDQLIRWFEGLWHGRTLAFTLLCITLPISFIFFLVAYYTPPDPKANGHGEAEGRSHRSS